MLFLQILEGPSAGKARPILVMADKNLIGDFVTTIAHRLSERTQKRAHLELKERSNAHMEESSPTKL
jgi:hypothetical protein